MGNGTLSPVAVAGIDPDSPDEPSFLREVEVPVNSTVTFYVTSRDIQHGFKLQDTNINMQIVPGQVSKLTHTFDEAGEYPYICTEYCGVGHAAMFGSLTVVEK